MTQWSRAGGMILGLFVLAAAAPAADQGEIKRAIERGVAYLKELPLGDGAWGPQQIGATALAGLTLLECDVPANDPAVRSAAATVRSAGAHLTHTYSVALSILFLDRLGEAADEPLIESLTVRLLAGQNSNGGWHYQCPDVPESEARRLNALLAKQRNELSTRPAVGAAGRAAPRVDDPQRLVTSQKLAEEIRQRIEVIHRAGGRKADHRDDNSNTQFAVLGLWVGRRHGLPVEGALALVNHRFRSSQNGDGGWEYRFHTSHNGHSTATMTCSGLLGLAAAHGAASEAALRTEKPRDGDAAKGGDKAAKAADPTRDRAVRAGLAALGSTIDHPAGPQNGRRAPVLGRGGRLYYFLWSLERVAVAYDLKTIGGKDWYGWGAEILLANQQDDGSWLGAYAGMGADTCFALLFLRRSNLASDLTLMLKGKVADPGEVVLKSGGVGGSAVKQQPGLRPILESPELFGGSEEEAAGTSQPRAGGAVPEAAKLGKQLVQAPAAERGSLIEKMRDGRGVAYTEALAAAIPKLEGDGIKKAREALAERLSRMTSETLGAKMDDDNPEVRRAAALAVAMKEDKANVGRLIELLDDEATVARAARAALKSLSGKDLGPAADATAAERARAVAAWRAWWQEKEKR